MKALLFVLPLLLLGATLLIAAPNENRQRDARRSANTNTVTDSQRAHYEEAYNALHARYDELFARMMQRRDELLVSNDELRQLQEEKEKLHQKMAQELARDEAFRRMQRELFALEQQAKMYADSVQKYPVRSREAVRP